MSKKCRAGEVEYCRCSWCEERRRIKEIFRKKNDDFWRGWEKVKARDDLYGVVVVGGEEEEIGEKIKDWIMNRVARGHSVTFKKGDGKIIRITWTGPVSCGTSEYDMGQLIIEVKPLPLSTKSYSNSGHQFSH